jgi:hypothetical protein
MVGFLPNIVDPEQAQIASFIWNFGDGHVSTLPPPNMVFNTYVDQGSYLATLQVTTVDGRSGVGFAGIVVTRPPK